MSTKEAFAAGQRGEGISIRNSYGLLLINPREYSPGLLIAISAGPNDSRIGLVIFDHRPAWDGHELNVGDNWLNVSQLEGELILSYCDGLGLE